MEVAKLRMLRWTCGKTMLDMISNGVFRTVLEVETIISKMREGMLRWFGHVRRRPQQAPVRRVEALIVNDKRRRGRPKLRLGPFALLGFDLSCSCGLGFMFPQEKHFISTSKKEIDIVQLRVVNQAELKLLLRSIFSV
ncbi:hypothetical protein Tco_0993812 [Tanacetum coccineum]